MPVYEYRCDDCNERFEMRRSFSESNAPAGCPLCRGDRTRRLLSNFYATSASSDGSSAPVAGGGGCAGCAGGHCGSCGH
jgi:putative FmdB family regulatory protein